MIPRKCRIMALHVTTDFSLNLLLFTVTDLGEWKVSDSARPYWRFYCNDRSGAVVYYEKQKIELEPEKFYLIAPGTDFTSSLARPLKHLNCNFTISEDAGLMPAGVYSVNVPMELLVISRDRLGAFFNTAEILDPAIVWHMRALISYCLSEVAHLFRPRKIYLQIIEDVLAYIDKSINEGAVEGFSNSELAERCSLHRNSFTRLFRKETGSSPQGYIMQKRIARCCLLLHDNSLSIDQIAEITGFCDRYHFSREFKKQMGLAPVRFRNHL